MKIESPYEVVALAKLLNFIKFDCDDEESVFYAGSPHINSLYMSVIEEIKKNEELKSSRGREDSQRYIEDNDFYYNAVKKNIKRTKNWSTFDKDEKKSYLIELLKPFTASEETFEDLIMYGDG